MTQEQIERKCQDYSKSATPSFVNGTFDRYAIAQAFEEGAKWRIASVWHKPGEKPEESEAILTLNERNSPTLYQIGYLGDWSFIAKTYHIVRWAYIKDLLPEE